MDGLLVRPPVFCTFFHRGRILALGRIGYWGHKEHAGDFCCLLYNPPSWSTYSVGAFMVSGGTEGPLVLITVIWPLFHRDHIIAMGRTGGYWWNDWPAIGSFCHFLTSHSSVTSYTNGAWLLEGQASCRCILLCYALSSLVVEFWLWGEYGFWWGKRDAGTFYCLMYGHSLGTSTHDGAYLPLYGRMWSSWTREAGWCIILCS